MISEQARRSIDTIFSKAAKSNLVINHGSDAIEITKGDSRKKSPITDKSKEMHILTIASYLFRLTTVFHVNDDKPTRSYFTQNAEGIKVGEVFSEFGNMCCGAMNRELGKHFIHLGMSTPYILDSACSEFLGELKANHVSSHSITINNDITIDATIFLRAFSTIDFKVDEHAEAEETGMIELF